MTQSLNITCTIGASDKRMFFPMSPPGEGHNFVNMNTTTATKKFALATLGAPVLAALGIGMAGAAHADAAAAPLLGPMAVARL